MRSRPWLFLLGLVILLCVQRGAVYSAPRVDLLGTYDGGIALEERLIHVTEERARLNVSEDILRGPVVPLIDYQYANYCGGSLIVSLLMMPLVAVMGPTLWVLRITALAFNLLALVLLYAILRRWVSQRAALFGGLLWALMTPGLLINTMVVWGTHVESNVLALGTLWLWLSLHSRPTGKTAKRAWLGVLQGLNLYIGYQTLLAIGMLAFFDLHRKGRPKASGWVAQGLGFLVGFAPWLWYNLRHDFSGFRIYEHTGSQNLVSTGAGEKLVGFFAHDLPTAQWFALPWESLGHTWGLIYTTALVLAAMFGALHFGRSPANPTAQKDSPTPNPAQVAGLWLLGFLALYTFTRFGVKESEGVFGYRYPLIAMPWLILAAGVGLDRLASWQAPGRALAWGVSLLFAGTSLWAAAPGLTNFDRFGEERTAIMTNTHSHVLWLFSSYRYTPERYPPLIANLRAKRTPEEFETMMRELGQKIQWLGADRPDFAPAQREYAAQMRELRATLLRELPPEMHAWFPEPSL